MSWHALRHGSYGKTGMPLTAWLHGTRDRSLKTPRVAGRIWVSRLSLRSFGFSEMTTTLNGCAWQLLNFFKPWA